MALNKWVGMGRITAPVELKTTPSGVSVTSFSIAIDRDFKDTNGEKQTDFINVVAWRNNAEFISKYFDKGSLICIEGSLQTRSYTTQDGAKRTVTEVVADRVHFTGEKRNELAGQNNGYTEPQPLITANYEEVEADDDLPF